MLFVSINDLNLLDEIPKAVDGIEFRVDLFSFFDLELLKNKRAMCTYLVMFTLRKKNQGGGFCGSEGERQSLIEQLLLLNPNFLDLEWDTCPHFIQHVLTNYPKTQLILSHHHLDDSPLHLEALYQKMTLYPAHGYKIAAFTPSTNDAIRMLLFARKHNNLTVICMGESGEFARVLGPVIGNRIHYACLRKEKQTAPGQLSVDELIEIYRYPKLNQNTLLYGLIGNPVSHSIGHRYHNQRYNATEANKVYVKMNVKSDELEEFFPLARELGFQGLSVTMPLKENVLSFVNNIEKDAKQIGAVNTLLFRNGSISGFNTDGKGALNAIEKKKKVCEKTMILIGAGGAARAIAFEACRRGADVLILNRTVERARKIAQSLGCRAGKIDDLPTQYDILINCSPNPMPIDPKTFLTSALVMDVVYHPRETPFLQKAMIQGCPVIFGEEMFLNQAAEQTTLWE